MKICCPQPTVEVVTRPKSRTRNELCRTRQSGLTRSEASSPPARSGPLRHTPEHISGDSSNRGAVSIATDSPRPAKRQRISFDATFDVIAGAYPYYKRYTLYRDALLSRAPFLRAAASENWSDKKKAVDLSDHEAEVFNAYLHCVYYGEVPEVQNADATAEKGAAAEEDKAGKEDSDGSGDSKTTGDEATDAAICDDNCEAHTTPTKRDRDSPADADEDQDFSDDDEAEEGEQALKSAATLFIKLYVLADKLGDLTVANLAISELIGLEAESSYELDGRQLCMIYRMTTDTSPLRGFAIDHAVHDSIAYRRGSPRQFLEDVYTKYLSLKWKQGAMDRPVCEVLYRTPSDRHRCYYH